MTLNRMTLVAAMILGLAATARAQSGGWSAPLAPLPSATAGDAAGRTNHCAAAWGGRVYVFGGQSDRGNSYSTGIYDPTTDSWTMGAAIPTHRLYAAAVTLGSEIYVIGGFAGSGTTAACESYNPATDAWTTTRAPMPTRRCMLAAVPLAGRIHAVGGNNGGTGSSSHEAYDPGTDTWSTLAGFPSAQGISEPGAAVIDGRIYTVGGNIPMWGNSFNCHRYDSAGDAWTDLGISGFPGRGMACAAMGRRIYAFGGDYGSQVISFHPRTGAVDSGLPAMPEGLSGSTAVTVGARIYVMGGENSGGYYRNINHAFTPPMVGSAPAILNLNQVRNGGAPVPPGGLTSLPLTLVAGVSDSDGGLLTLEIEVRPAGENFTGEPTVVGTAQPATQAQVFDLTGIAGGPWQWQARLVDDQDNLSPWVEFAPGTAADFIVDGTPPSIPTPISPVGGVTLDDSQVTLRWTTSTDDSGVAGYDVQVAQDPGFAMLVSYRQVPGPAMSIELSNGRYYWRVLATDGAGTASAWSATAEFIMDDDTDHAAGDATKVCGFSAPASGGGLGVLLLALLVLAVRRGWNE